MMAYTIMSPFTKDLFLIFIIALIYSYLIIHWYIFKGLIIIIVNIKDLLKGLQVSINNSPHIIDSVDNFSNKFTLLNHFFASFS